MFILLVKVTFNAHIGGVIAVVRKCGVHTTPKLISNDSFIYIFRVHIPFKRLEFNREAQ